MRMQRFGFWHSLDYGNLLFMAYAEQKCNGAGLWMKMVSKSFYIILPIIHSCIMLSGCAKIKISFRVCFYSSGRR